MLINNKILYLAKIVIVIILFSNTSYSQKGNMVLLQGKLKEFKTGEAIGTNFEFVSANGKRIMGKSNTTDGSFQVVLSPGENYIPVFDGFITTSHIEVVSPNVKEYTEIFKDFTLKKIDVGLDIFEIKAFEPNDSTVANSSKIYFNELKTFLSKNLKAIVTITISANDTYFSDIKKTIKVVEEKKKKKVTKQKQITITAREQALQFVEARGKYLTEYLESINLKDKRYKIEYNLNYIKSKPVAAKPSKSSKKKKIKEETQPKVTEPINNLKVVISKMLKL